VWFRVSKLNKIREKKKPGIKQNAKGLMVAGQAFAKCFVNIFS